MQGEGALVERRAELALLEGALRAAAVGDGRTVVLTGQAGIGKTALLESARQLAARTGMTVLSAQGAALEDTFAFGVVRQLFEGPLRAATVEERRELLAGAAELAARVVAVAGTATDGAPADPMATLHGLFWLTVNLAERAPLLICVDDAHWCDASSLAWLAHLARRLADLPVALIVARRSGEEPVDPAALQEVEAAAGGEVVAPAPLTAVGVAALVQERLGAEPALAFVDACVEATGGVPFLLLELLGQLRLEGVLPTAEGADAIARAGPPSVAAATLARVGRLPAPAAEVAQAAAVLGRHARLDRIASLARAELAEVEAAVDALLATGVLGSGHPLRFAHPLVHQAVHEAMLPAARAAAHRRAAMLLAEQEADPEDVAAHLLLTHPAGDRSVVTGLRGAAATASASGSPGDAAAYLRRALAEDVATERAGLLSDLARAEVLAQEPAAEQHLEQAAALATAPVEQARLLWELGELVLFTGQWDRRLALLSDALDTLGERDRQLQARIEATRNSSELYDPRYAASFAERAPGFRELLRHEGPGTRALALIVACLAALRGMGREEVLPLVDQGLAHGGPLRDEGPASLVLPHALAALLALDEVDAAERATSGVLDAARRLGSVPGTIAGSSYRMAVAAQRGELRSAEADLRTAFELAVRHGNTFALTGLVTFGVDVLLERPDLADVVAVVDAVELPPVWAATASGAWLMLAQGRLAALGGDAGRGRSMLRQAGETFTAVAMTNPILALWRSPLASLLPVEERQQAADLAAAELRDAEAASLPRSRAIALRALGTVQRGGDGIALLESSLEVLDGCDAPLERARTLVELGGALRRSNRRAAALEPLTAGLDLADHCGAERLAGRAEQELRAAGARPRRRARSGLESLTASELRVAGLAADGLTNRDIAQTLFVSPKTVENHLGATYRKLGVHARDELGEALRTA